MWFNLFLPEFFKGEDKVFKVRVVDDRGNVDGEFHLRSNGSTMLEGYYKVPYEAETGIYRVFVHGINRFIGQDMKMLEAKIPVYNDFEFVKAELSDGDMNDKMSLQDLGIEIELAGQPSANGEAELLLKVSDNNGPVEADLSVSVVDATLSSAGVVVEGELVEMRGVQALHNSMVMKGTIYDKQGNTRQINVLGAYSPDVQRVVYSKSDDNGKFYVNVPDFIGDRTVQFLGYSVEIVDFDVTVPNEFSAEPITDKVEYTERVLEYLDLSRKRKKMYQYFTTVEQNLEPEPIIMDVQKLKPDYRFDMDEYEEFETVFAFFDELITALRFQKKDSIYTASLENPKGRNVNETNLRGEPLFIVDGIATRNADFVARLDLSIVKYVDLYYDPYKLRKYYNAVGRSGVIMISTKLQEFDFPEEEFADVFTMHGLLPKADFPSFTNRSESIPRIAPQIYWDGNVVTDYDGTAEVKYRQSADRTRCRVHVVAQSVDGKRGEAILEYDIAN